MENCISGLFLRQLMNVRVMDFHAKAAGTLRDGLANSSHAQDAEYFAGQLPTQECAAARHRPLAGSDCASYPRREAPKSSSIAMSAVGSVTAVGVYPMAMCFFAAAGKSI